MFEPTSDMKKRRNKRGYLEEILFHGFNAYDISCGNGGEGSWIVWCNTLDCITHFL